MVLIKTFILVNEKKKKKGDSHPLPEILDILPVIGAEQFTSHKAENPKLVGSGSLLL